MTEVNRIRVKDRLEYAAVRAAVGLLASLPPRRAAGFSAFFWRLIAPRTRRQRRVIEHLRAAFPHLTEGEVERLSIRMWDHLGRVTAETFHLPDLQPLALKSPRDFNHLSDFSASADKGAVVASGHLGAYELVVLSAHAVGLRPCGIYQQLSNPLVDRLLVRLRAPLYPAGLFAKSHKTARTVLNIVRGGGTAAFLADLRELRGEPVGFFGRPAYANPFPARLARHCDVPFIAGRVIRRGDGGYVLEAERVIVPRTEDSRADVTAATQNFHSILERYIREYPEQWMWAHRKWAMPPSPPAAGA